MQKEKKKNRKELVLKKIYYKNWKEKLKLIKILIIRSGYKRMYGSTMIEPIDDLYLQFE